MRNVFKIIIITIKNSILLTFCSKVYFLTEAELVLRELVSQTKDVQEYRYSRTC